jgi:hypothetical protein
VSSPHLGLMTRFFYCLRFTALLLCGALSDERMGRSFVYAARPCQRSLSRVRVSWNSRPYFTVSDSRLPFSLPFTTRRVTVEVFNPASTRETDLTKVKVTLRLTVSQSVRLGVEPHLGHMIRYLVLPAFFFVGHPLWREDGSVFCQSHCLH